MSNTRKMLLVTNVTEAKSEKERIDGKASCLFVGVTFAEVLQSPNGKIYENPFKSGFRNIFQRHSADGQSAKWKVTPEQLNTLKNEKLAIPGEIVTRTVERFPVLGVDGKQSKTKNGELVFADKYTAVVLEGESIEAIFKAAGHKIVAEQENAQASQKEVASLLV